MASMFIMAGFLTFSATISTIVKAISDALDAFIASLAAESLALGPKHALGLELARMTQSAHMTKQSSSDHVPARWKRSSMLLS